MIKRDVKDMWSDELDELEEQLDSFAAEQAAQDEQDAKLRLKAAKGNKKRAAAITPPPQKRPVMKMKSSIPLDDSDGGGVGFQLTAQPRFTDNDDDMDVDDKTSSKPKKSAAVKQETKKAASSTSTQSKLVFNKPKPFLDDEFMFNDDAVLSLSDSDDDAKPAGKRLSVHTILPEPDEPVDVKPAAVKKAAPAKKKRLRTWRSTSNPGSGSWS